MHRTAEGYHGAAVQVGRVVVVPLPAEVGSTKAASVEVDAAKENQTMPAVVRTKAAGVADSLQLTFDQKGIVV